VTGFDDIEYASLTDVGVRRSHNQDNHAILLATDESQWQTRGHVFLVADGMGAHAVGELAAALAVGIIPHTYDKHAAQGTAAALRKAFVEANTSIHARGQQNREFEGMGTTATALVLRADGAWVAHVGDSRTYRIRNNQIDQLSFDHSMVWEYARRQRIDPDEVRGIPPNVIFRSLGPEPLVPVDIEGVHPLRDGDLFVLCSDGLSGQVTDPEIGAVASVFPPAEACRFLVDLANLRGGPDNITVVIVRAGRSLATPPPPRRPWGEIIPWPLASLLAGAVFAGCAVFLTADQRAGAAILTFLLAVVAVLAGLIGLIAHHRQEQRRATQEADRPRPKIHRSQPCRIDQFLIDKFTRIANGLKQQAREKNWEIDWAKHQSFAEATENNLTMGDFVPAFRECCRALQLLMTAAHAQRGKEEVFQPNWDRHDLLRAPLGFNGREAASFRCDLCGKTSPVAPAAVAPVCCERPMTRVGS
jgi:protein phosphatase